MRIDNPDGAAPAADRQAAPALLTKAMIRKHYVPLGKRTFNRWISSGQFPPADIVIGGKVRWWRRGTVETWIERQAAGGGR